MTESKDVGEPGFALEEEEELAAIHARHAEQWKHAVCDEERYNWVSEAFAAQLYCDIGALLRHIAPLAWQPIETAPKDGRDSLAFVDGFGMGQMVLFWSDGYWREKANCLGLKKSPTHWQPLPKPPSTSSSSEAAAPTNPQPIKGCETTIANDALGRSCK